MITQKNELLVVSKAKELCSYIVVVTGKAPKQFRFTFVTRLQNLALSVIEDIYHANDIFLQKGDTKHAEQRLDLQHRAITSIKLIAFMSEIFMKEKCIMFKQYEQIAKLTTDCQNLIGAWINSDRKRV